MEDVGQGIAKPACGARSSTAVSNDPTSYDQVPSLERIPTDLESFSAVQSLADMTRPSVSSGGSSSRSSDQRQRRPFGAADSQRSVISMDEEDDESLDNNIMMGDEETMRLVGQAQEEELIQYAMECSLSERSGGSGSGRLSIAESVGISSSDLLSPQRSAAAGIPNHHLRAQQQQQHAASSQHSPPPPQHRSGSQLLRSSLSATSAQASPSMRPSPKSALSSSLRASRASFSSFPLDGVATSTSARSLNETSSLTLAEQQQQQQQQHHHLPMSLNKDGFRRSSSERLRVIPPPMPTGALEFFDLSPCDEAEFRRVVRVPPPTGAGALDATSGHSQRSRDSSVRSALDGKPSPGAVAVNAPAPKIKVKSPGGGLAVNVPEPAPIDKPDEVRDAIIAHVTSTPPTVPRSTTTATTTLPDSSQLPKIPPLQAESPKSPKPLSGHTQQNSAMVQSSSPDEARRAVLAIAKSHLPPMEAQIIEQALQLGLGTQPLQPETSEATTNASSATQPPPSAWQIPIAPPKESTTSADWPTLGEQSPPVAPPQPPAPSEMHEDISAEELMSIERAIRESVEQQAPNDNLTFPESAADNFTAEELREIQKALEGSPDKTTNSQTDEISVQAQMREMADDNFAMDHVDDEQAIARALREADEEEERRSFELAMKIQLEEDPQYNAAGDSGAARQRHHQQQPQGNVRSMTREEYERQGVQIGTEKSQTSHAGEEDDDDEEFLAAGYRMNSTSRQQWARRDQNSVVGPNREVRTKHDTTLNGQANVQRLGLDVDEVATIGNQAFNSFRQSVQAATKGSDAKGGRTGSDANVTRGGGMDLTVRGNISRAINNNLIEKCNGVVKEGKEAIVYHADRGSESGDFDVAVKVFKKIQEFRGRGDFVDGDPRYGVSTFRNLSKHEQLKVWAEKEFRNLVRANRACVPVPFPLDYDDNIVYMRFLGTEGWPSPQLRELELRKGSSRWDTLYTQVLEAIQRLYQKGRLVHGDLSEYNILVVPSHFIDLQARSNLDVADEDLHIALIDFGQAVDANHPSAHSLLERDLDRVLTFFGKQGVETMTSEEALSLVFA